MKRIVSILIVLVMCLALVSCGEAKNTDVPDGMKLVESDDAKSYSLYVPESWIVDMSTGTISAYASTRDTSNITFTAFTPESVLDLDVPTFWAGYADDFKSTFGDNMHYISGGKEVSAEKYEPAVISDFGGSGSDAYQYVYTALVSGDTYKFMQVVCAAGGYIYIFTYTSTLDNYDSHVEEVQSILDNFKFN